MKHLFRSLFALFLLTSAVQSAEVITWISPYGIPEAIKQIDLYGDKMGGVLTRVGLQFWTPRENGTIFYATHENVRPTDGHVRHFQEWAQQHNVKLLLCLYNYNGSWDWDLAQNAFRHKEGETLAQALSKEVERLGLDGVDVDLEGIGDFEKDRAAFNSFIDKLSAKLKKKGKILTVDTFHSPCLNAPNMSWWKSWIGKVDQIHAMGYQDLYEGATDSTLCDIKGIFQYSTQLGYAKKEGLPDGMVLMGMPLWIDHWGSGGKGSRAVDHLLEIKAVKAGVALWELEKWGLTPGWVSDSAWSLLAEIKRGEWE